VRKKAFYGKTMLLTETVKLLGTRHPGGSSSVAQAGDQDGK
jgi:hypothetical protein